MAGKELQELATIGEGSTGSLPGGAQSGYAPASCPDTCMYVILSYGQPGNCCACAILSEEFKPARSKQARVRNCGGMSPSQHCNCNAVTAALRPQRGSVTPLFLNPNLFTYY